MHNRFLMPRNDEEQDYEARAHLDKTLSISEQDSSINEGQGSSQVYVTLRDLQIELSAVTQDGLALRHSHFVAPLDRSSIDVAKAPAVDDKDVRIELSKDII